MTEDLVFSKTSKGFVYNRLFSAEVTKLSNIMKDLYNANSCIVTPSGMAAISILFNGIIMANHSQKINIYYGSELYTNTNILIKNLTQVYDSRINIWCFDIRSDIGLINLIKKHHRDHLNIIFAESCSNPSGNIFFFESIPNLKFIDKNITIIIDNTWLSSAIFNPFNFDVDYVVVSLSKYYSANKAIGGAILSKSDDNIFYECMTWMKNTGIHTSPHNALVISTSIANLDFRMRKSSEVTIQVIKNLSTKINILHPYNNAFAKKYFKYMPSVFTFELSKTKKEVDDIMIKSKKIEYKSSFGHALSRIDPYPQTINNKIQCRISIGYIDTVDKIINGLENFIT